MNTWNHSYSRDIAATPEAIWSAFADTANWKRWNAGVKEIHRDSAFATGGRFTMEMPDGDSIDSLLVSVSTCQHFIDESRLGDIVVRVEHRIEALEDRRSRVVYTISVQGPQAREVGEAVSADFPSVLEGLDQYLAEAAIA